MKKYFLFLTTLLAAAAVISCGEKDNIDDDGNGKEAKSVTLSIKADASFDENNSATVTLTLSDPAPADVTVKLSKADVQSGKTEVPADFNKEVTIRKGEKTATVSVMADILGLKEGEYQFALKIASAEGAELPADPVVYINLTFVFVPEVNLFADNQFASNCEAKLTVGISKAASKAVTVKIALDSQSKAEAEFDDTVVIPAGETSRDIIVKVKLADNLAAGTYPVIVKIASIENGKEGSNNAVTINLNYPFSTTVYIDGEFDDWAGALEWPTPEDAEFKGIRTLKLAASPSKLYIYFEIVEPSPDNFDAYPMPIDIFLDCDGSYATGGKLTSTDNENTTLPYVDSGLNWYIELGNVHSGNEYTDFTYGAYKFIGSDGATIWSLDNKTGQYGADQMFGIGVLGDDGIGRLEIQIDRTYFELINTQAQVGIKVMNGNGGWACYGLTPIGPMEGGASKRVDMALINMPEYAVN